MIVVVGVNLSMNKDFDTWWATQSDQFAGFTGAMQNAFEGLAKCGWDAREALESDLDKRISDFLDKTIS